VRRRRLENDRVVERAPAVDGAGPDPERGACAHDFGLGRRTAVLADLDLDPALVHVDRLVLLVVELEAELLARADEEKLPTVVVALSPNGLVPPRLLDPARLEGEGVDPSCARRLRFPAHRSSTARDVCGEAGSRSAVSGSASSGEVGRPIPSYAKPAARTSPGSSKFRPSMIKGFRIALRIPGDASPRSCSHSVTITAASAPCTASSTVA